MSLPHYTDCINAQCRANSIASDLYAAFWLDNTESQHIADNRRENALKNLRSLAFLFGYSLEPLPLYAKENADATA